MPSAVVAEQTCDEYVTRRKHANVPANANELPKELKRDHGFAPLPKKFNILVTLFGEMEKILQSAFEREQRKTFAQLAANVEKNSKKKFTEQHLSQIVAIYPNAYTLRWERPKEKRSTQLGLWDLVIHPNLYGNKDLSPFTDSFLASTPELAKATAKEKEAIEKSPSKCADNEAASWAIPPANGQQCSPLKRTAADLPLSPVKLISPMKSPRRNQVDYIFRSPVKPRQTVIYSTPVLDTRPKMDANRLKWRKLIFRHLLVNRVREVHNTFLRDNKLTFDDDQSVHDWFKEVMDELVPDIPTEGAIPLRRKLNMSPSRNLQTTDIRSFLQSVKCKTPAAEREKTPESRPPPLVTKSEPKNIMSTPRTQRTIKFEPDTPKTPLEERLKAKFAANEAARKAGLPDMQKRRAMLHKLDNTILEVLRAHLNLEQRFSVGLTDRTLLQKMGREINAVSLLEHLQLLCSLLPPKEDSSEEKLFWLESIGAKKNAGPEAHFFKVSRKAGPGWVEEASKLIKSELVTLEQKIHTLHRSPSSLF